MTPASTSSSPTSRCPGSTAWRCCSGCRPSYPDVPVIMITAHGTVDNAVEAIKPARSTTSRSRSSRTQIRQVVAKAIEHATRSPRRDAARPRSRRRAARFRLVGQSPAIQQIYARRSRRSPTRRRRCSSPASPAPARSWSPGRCTRTRRAHDEPFIKINCAAIPKTLMESELFGYEKGAFTGARRRQAGPLRARRRRHAVPRRDRRDPGRDAGQAAARAPGARVRARRRHQDDQGRRPPDHRDQPRPRAGDRAPATFREDLYYRLNVVPLHIPPLRERARATSRCSSSTSSRSSTSA